MKKFVIFIIFLCTTSCVRYSDDLRDAAHTQLNVTFFESLHTPASFTVQLRPYDAIRILNGEQVPITLHTILDRQLNADTSSINSKYRYLVIVEKKLLLGQETAFSKSYNKVMEAFHVSEAPYIIEITIDEIIKNVNNEDVFGKQIAIFSTSLVRSEQDIAYDIITLIQNNIH